MSKTTRSYLAQTRTGGVVHAVSEVGGTTDNPLWVQTSCGRLISLTGGERRAWRTSDRANVSCKTCKRVIA